MSNPPDRFGPPDRGQPAPDPGMLDRPVFDNFVRAVAATPNAPALRGGARALTYAETLRQVRALAARLIAATEPGTGIAVLLTDDVDVTIAQLACFASGRVCLLLNPVHPAPRLAAIIATAAPSALLISDDFEPPPDTPVSIAILRGLPTGEEDTDIALPAVDRDAPAIVVYTSGSTGTPKGYVRTQRQIMNRLERYLVPVRIGPDDRVLTLFSMTNGSGTWAGWAALLSGAELHVSGGASSGLRAVMQQIRTQAITALWSIPTMLRTLLALPDAREAFRSVRAICSVSESILSSDLEAWRRVLPPGCAIRLTYSMTETSGLAAWFLPHDAGGLSARLPVGYPSDAFDFAIVTPEGEPAPIGEVGELWVSGPMITVGEWQAGRCVPSRAIADPTDPSRRILRTNDLARLRPDGLLEFAGRADDMVKVRGNRVEPAEIEDVLRRLDSVADVAVRPIRTETDARLVAYVVPAPGATTTAAALNAHLRARLPGYMVPSRIEFLPVLPRLANGKIDARRLADDGA